MKWSSPITAIVLLFGLSSLLRAQTGSVSGGAGGGTTQPVNSGASSSYSDRGSAASGATDKNSTLDPNYQEKATDENDDTLYRGRTSETENPMIRDEGPLHFKTQRKEKVQEVNSLNNLQRSSATDKAFEGNLLHSSVSSINDVVPSKAKTASEAEAPEPRFSDKSLTFVREKSDGRQGAQKDSSPSPTPSPTASPRTKDSSQKN